MTDEFPHFVEAQDPVYGQVIEELKRGQKRSHWMWFVFPQIAGLGNSQMAQRFALHSLDEAARYVEHPVLGKRLRECTQLVVNVRSRDISDIVGYPDDLKFHSSMSLFALAVPGEPLFAAALEKYFHGLKDSTTVELTI